MPLRARLAEGWEPKCAVGWKRNGVLYGLVVSALELVELL